MDKIFQNITESFGKLWHCVQRGSTIEVITPYATINDKFVSVFITVQGAEYVVTDAGWCSTNEYEQRQNDDKAYSRIISYYESSFQIKKTKANTNILYYYKTTKNALLIPNLVFDLCNFISSIISASFVSFEDVKEKETQTRFKTSANEYISSIILSKNCRFGECISEQHSDVKFNAIITNSLNSLTLVTYITGSTPHYFGNSLTKAYTSIEIIQESSAAQYIDKYIAIVDNMAKGCDRGGKGSFYNALQKKTCGRAIDWTEKAAIKQLLVA